MKKEVTVRALNIAFMKELFRSKLYWIGFVLYVLGLIFFYYRMGLGGIIMFIGSIVMLNADWNGRKKVVRKLRWVKSP